ncbi:MAG: tandem-95 repeat protein [Pirellulaceae bacterium]
MNRHRYIVPTLVFVLEIQMIYRPLLAETLEKRHMLTATVTPLYFSEIPYHELDNAKLALETDASTITVRATRFGGDPTQARDDGENDTNRPDGLPVLPPDPLLIIKKFKWGGENNDDWEIVVERQNNPWQPNAESLTLPNGEEIGDWTRLTLFRRQDRNWRVVLVIHNDGWIRQTHLAQDGVPAALGSSVVIGPTQTVVDPHIGETRVYANVFGIEFTNDTDSDPRMRFDYRIGGTAELDVVRVDTEELVYQVTRGFESPVFGYLATMWAEKDILSDASAMSVQTLDGEIKYYHLPDLEHVEQINDVRALSIHRWEQSNHNSTGPGIVISFADREPIFHSYWVEAEQHQAGSGNHRSEMSGDAQNRTHKTATMPAEQPIAVSPVLTRPGYHVPAIRYGHHDSNGREAIIRVTARRNGTLLGTQEIALPPTDTTAFSGAGRNIPAVVYGEPMHIPDPNNVEFLFENITPGMTPEADVFGFLYGGMTLQPPTAADDRVQVTEDTTTLIDVLANDYEPTAQPLSISILAQPKNGVARVENGRIEYDPANDFSGADELTYRIADPDGGQSIAKVSIDVQQVNDRPNISAIDSVDLLEDDSAFVGLEVTDDGPGPLSFNMTATNETLFPADAFVLTGELGNKTLQLKPAENRFGESNVTIRVVDAEGASATHTIRVVVSPQNDAPDAIELSGRTILENAQGAIVGSLSVHDVDPADTHQWSVLDPRFEIVGDRLKLKDTESIDFETESLLTVGIVAMDNGGLELQQFFGIDVSNVNDPPTVAVPFADDETYEGITYSRQLPPDAFSDQDGDALTISLTMADGAELPSWLTFDPVTGWLIGRPEYESANPYQLRLAVSDSFVESSVSFTLTVKDTVNRLHHPKNRHDVNDDGEVTPLDALIVINRIQAQHSGGTVPIEGAPFTDVNNDEAVTPIDALVVINYLASQANQRSGELDFWSVPTKSAHDQIFESFSDDFENALLMESRLF